MKKEFHVFQKLFPEFQTDSAADKISRSVHMRPGFHEVSESFQQDTLLPEMDYNDSLPIFFRPHPVLPPECPLSPEIFWKLQGLFRRNDNLQEVKVLLPDKLPENGKKY